MHIVQGVGRGFKSHDIKTRAAVLTFLGISSAYAKGLRHLVLIIHYSDIYVSVISC